MERSVAREPLDRGPVAAVAESQPRRDGSVRFAVPDARDAPELRQRPRRSGLDEGDRHVLPLRQAKLGVHHEFHGVLLHVPQHEDRAGEADPERRQSRLHRPARDVPGDHAARLRQEPPKPQPFRQRHPEPARRLRKHRLGGGHPFRLPHRLERPQDGGGDAHQRGGCRHGKAKLVAEVRKPVEGHVHPGHPPPQPSSHPDPAGHPDEDDQHDQLHVIHSDNPVRIAERLQNADLVPLQADQPSHDHVQQERRHAQEDDGEDRRERPQLPELLAQVAVGQLIVPRVRPQPAVWGKNRVDAIHRVLAGSARSQCRAEVVERPLQPGRRGQRFPPHPEDAVPLRVREDLAGAHFVHVFRGQADPDDAERFPLAVDHRSDPVPGPQPVRLRERLARDDLVVPSRGHVAPLPKMQRVQCRLARVRNGDQEPADRLREPRYVDVRPRRDARLHAVHPGERPHGFRGALRGALQGDEQLREPEIPIENGPGLAKGVEGAHGDDVGGHAADDDHRDGEGLPLHPPQIPKQLSAQRLHGVTTASPAGISSVRSAPWTG